MASIFFTLAIVSGILALGGYVWSVAKDLRTRRQEALAAEETREPAHTMGDHDTIVVPTHAGTAGSDTPDAPSELSFAGVGARLRRQGLRAALPGLLMAAGILAVLVFGALALYTSLPSKLFGAAALTIAAYVSATELRAFARAWRGQEK
jgi:hypothetical protein